MPDSSSRSPWRGRPQRVGGGVGQLGHRRLAAVPPRLPRNVPSPSPTHRAAARPWLDTSLTIDQRVAALLSQMTLDEKIGQMTQIESDSIDPGRHRHVPAGQHPGQRQRQPTPARTTPQNWYAMVDGYQQAALGTRLGIPIMYGVDMVHGASHLTGTTIFPHNIGLGATRDPALVTQVCRVTAEESAAAGVRWAFGPVVAVPQDVRWGRTYEGYGEDTDLVSQLGAACITGLQGDDLDEPDIDAGHCEALPGRWRDGLRHVHPEHHGHPVPARPGRSRTWTTPPSPGCSCRRIRRPSRLARGS